MQEQQDRYRVRALNTFIHVDLPLHPARPVRCQSCPPESKQGILKATELVFKAPPHSHSQAETDLTDVPTSESSQIQQAMTQNNKKRQRPCRAKRQRYRKFVNKLKAEIVADPSSFDMRQVVLLPSLIDHPERLHKLTLYLESFQEQVGGTLNA